MTEVSPKWSSFLQPAIELWWNSFSCWWIHWSSSGRPIYSSLFGGTDFGISSQGSVLFADSYQLLPLWRPIASGLPVTTGSASALRAPAGKPFGMSPGCSPLWNLYSGRLEIWRAFVEALLFRWWSEILQWCQPRLTIPASTLTLFWPWESEIPSWVRSTMFLVTALAYPHESCL